MKRYISLLNQFKIPGIKSRNEYNLIGADYGDGDLEVIQASWNEMLECWDYKTLYLHENHTVDKRPNAFVYNAMTKRGAAIVRTVRTEGYGKNDISYYNFKKPVSEADAVYLQDDGTEAPLTYAEAMAEGFNILIQDVFRSNTSIDRGKPTIILVGRPSSPGWQASQQEYARLLRTRLDLSAYTDQPVYVLVYSEAMAALARQTDPQWRDNPVRRGMITVVLDCGSSTFDIVLINANGIPAGGEDSFQFGGNMIDENITKCILRHLEDKGLKPYTINGLKLTARLGKEGYYGEDGTNLNPFTITIRLEGELNDKGRAPRENMQVDDALIDEVLNVMPVEAGHLDRERDNMPELEKNARKSWTESCRDIFQSFFDTMNEKGFFGTKARPDRVILTGGLSVMPEIKKLAGEVFECNDMTVTERPNFAVAEGLAYLLKCEVEKQVLLLELKEKVQVIVPSTEELRTELIEMDTEDDWEVIIDSLRSWADEDGYLSINDYYNNYFVPAWNKAFRSPDRNLFTEIQFNTQKWYKKNRIDSRLNEELDKCFKENFGSFVTGFSYALPGIDFSSIEGCDIRISLPGPYMFGDLTANEDKHYIYSDLSKNRKRDKMWRKNAYDVVVSLKDGIINGDSRDVNYNVLKFFNGNTKVSAIGIRQEVAGESNNGHKGIVPEAVVKIRNEIIRQLEEQVEDYVEEISPYFVMSSREE